jgi:hypothetical protein
MKKVLAILLIVLFVVSLTAGTASAARRGGGGGHHGYMVQAIYNRPTAQNYYHGQYYLAVTGYGALTSSNGHGAVNRNSDKNCKN